MSAVDLKIYIGHKRYAVSISGLSPFKCQHDALTVAHRKHVPLDYVGAPCVAK